MKKILSSLLLIILALSMSVFAFNFRSVKAGTIVVPDNYPTIQEAINHAGDGDTVYVRAGTYYENVVVNKRITLLGENPQTAIIDGSGVGDVVKVTADDATVMGFKMRNGGAYEGIALLTVKNCNVTRNELDNVWTGVLISVSQLATSSSSNSVVGNNITNSHTAIGLQASGHYGIRCFNNSICGNRITSCQCGIALKDSDNNSLAENSIVADSGIVLTGGQGNVIFKNSIEGGISLSYWMDGPIYFSAPKYNTVCENSITSSSKGIWLCMYADDNSIIGNKMTGNVDGVWLTGSRGNSISGNSIVANSRYGIEFDWGMHGVKVTSDGNTVSDNNIADNAVGVWLNSSSNNRVFHNNFVQNSIQARVDSLCLNNGWDDGYPSGGNHWSNYLDVDSFRGPEQDVLRSDGVWDHPYAIDADNTDHYPLVNPWVRQETLAVRGMDDRMYYRACNGVGWQDWMILPGSTVDSPAVAMLGNQLHFVVRGSDGKSLWHGYLTNPADPSSFSGWTLMTGATSSAPTLSSNGTVLCLVVRGLNNRVYYRCYIKGYVWEVWHAVPSGATCNSPAAAMLGNGLHMVVRGMDGSSLWHTKVSVDGSGSPVWTRLSGATPSKPALASSRGSNKLYLVVRGMDNGIWYRDYTGSTSSWGNWARVPTGATCDGSGATVWFGELHLVVRGMDGNTLWDGRVDLATNGSLGWTPIDGATPSAPTLAC